MREGGKAGRARGRREGEGRGERQSGFLHSGVGHDCRVRRADAVRRGAAALDSLKASGRAGKRRAGTHLEAGHVAVALLREQARRRLDGCICAARRGGVSEHTSSRAKRRTRRGEGRTADDLLERLLQPPLGLCRSRQVGLCRLPRRGRSLALHVGVLRLSRRGSEVLVDAGEDAELAVLEEAVDALALEG